MSNYDNPAAAFLRAMKTPISQAPEYKFPPIKKPLYDKPILIPGIDFKSEVEKTRQQILNAFAACVPVHNTNFDFKSLVEFPQVNIPIGGRVLNSQQVANIINGKDDNGKPINHNNLITDFYYPPGNNISNDKRLT